jgi:hypothetical protein
MTNATAACWDMRGYTTNTNLIKSATVRQINLWIRLL